MHFKSVALLALASVAIASPHGDLAQRQASSVTLNPTEVSVLAVLATALPPSLVSIGITNPAEVGAIIASSFSAGQTPGWYSALPPDVKSYLPILYAEQTQTPASPLLSSTPAPSSSASAPVVTVASTSAASVIATISPSGNNTVVSTVHSATLSSPAATTVGGGASSKASAASSTSTGGASYPTAVVGAGIAGALGFLGMLAM